MRIWYRTNKMMRQMLQNKYNSILSGYNPHFIQIYSILIYLINIWVLMYHSSLTLFSYSISLNLFDLVKAS